MHTPHSLRCHTHTGQNTLDSSCQVCLLHAQLFFLSGVNRLLRLRQQCVQFMSVCHYASFQSRLYIPVNVVDISSCDLASSIIAAAVKYDYIPAYNITIILNNWIQSANNQL